MAGPPIVPFNFLAIPPRWSTLSSARVVVLPVPYDGTASYLAGSRDGPRAVLDASRSLEDFDLELGIETYRHGIYTAPELEPHVGSPWRMAERVRSAVSKYLDLGKFVTVLGGDHSVTIGSAYAHLNHYPDLSILYLDAHADLRDSYQGSRFSHACVARRIQERMPLVAVGVRSLSSEEYQYIRERAIPVFFWEQPFPQQYSPEEVCSLLSSHVYVSVDLDVFDPSLMAAVGTPEPGGMMWANVMQLLRRVGETCRIVGFDITELSPREGPKACAVTAAQLAYKLMGYALRHEFRG